MGTQNKRKDLIMSNWRYRLELKDLWKAKKRGDLTIQELGKKVAKRIEKLPCYKKYEDELMEIVIGFEIVESIAVFDYYLGELYDWADKCLPTPKGFMQKKICWVATF